MEAERYMDEALRLGTRDASLFFHAGKIQEALGRLHAARWYVRQAIEINPHFSILHSKDARRTLASLSR